jgi:hypothetical protein
MLVRAPDQPPFPPNDLAYLAFALAATHTFFGLRRAAHDGGSRAPAEPVGYLGHVPLLSHLPGAVQIDLLADTWVRHDTHAAYEATGLDAVILSSVCETATALVRAPGLTVSWVLIAGVRQLDMRFDAWTEKRIGLLFNRWWPDFDPRELRTEEDIRFPPRLADPIYAVLGRTQPSPSVLANLASLFHLHRLGPDRRLLQIP